MANTLYDPGREGILDHSIDMTGAIKLLLVKSAYTYSAAHKFVSDVTSGNIIARSGNLASKTYTSGVFDAADLTVVAVPGGANVTYLVLYNDDPGTDATKRLIGYIDTATGLPLTPSGADETFGWDNGGNKIFKL